MSTMKLGECFCFILIAVCASATTTDMFSSSYQDMCHKHTFKDPRCYVVAIHHSVTIMQCGAGTYFNNITCGCDLRVDSLPYDLAPVNCQNFQSQLSSSAVSSHQNSLSCDSVSYRFLENLKTQDPCHTSDAVWSHLEDIRSHTSTDCVKKIVAEMHQYYKPWLETNGLSACTCNGAKKFMARPTENTDACYYHDSSFKQLYRTVFGSRNTYNVNSYGRYCQSHNTVWAYVDLISKAHSSNTCLEMLLRIMNQAFQHVSSSDSCSCSATAHVTTTHAPAAQVNNDYCSHYTYYTDIHNLIGNDQCMPVHAVLVRLNQLISAGTKTARCADQLIKDMYAAYGQTTDTPTNCTCSTATHHSASFTTVPQCTRIPIYNEITSTYSGISHAYCSTHHQVWSSFNSLMHTDVTCLYDIIKKTASSSRDNGCVCHAGHATATTATPVTQSHTPQCHEYSGYKELMNVISADKCVSFTKVWAPLQILGSQRESCLKHALHHLAALYNHFDNSTCSCSHSGSDDLIFQPIHGGQRTDCTGHFRTTYGALLTNVLGPHIMTRGSQGYCWTHQTIWSQLHLLSATNTHSFCLMDLISHLALSTHGHADTCSCHPVSVTSSPPTNNPVTVHPTSHPVTANPPVTLQPCQKLETLIALAHNSYLMDNAAPCPAGGHSKAEATVVDLCKAPASTSWQKGYNVLQHCDDIPPYTAVASFAGDLYVGDGVSGVLISCNTTSLRIATERCDHPMEVVTVVTGARDQYTHMAENYYTIQW